MSNPNDYDDPDKAIEELTQPFFNEEDRVNGLVSSDASIQEKRLTPVMDPKSKEESDAMARSLLIAFLAMVVVGLGNKIFQVLMFQPMNNYPLFVNMFSTFVYVPVSFAYIIPMLKYGKAITKEQTDIPKRVFLVMGFLDSLAGIMQSLSVAALSDNGSLVILLQQAAIPVSMIISYILLQKRYTWSQYGGAMLVGGGIILVLMPYFLHPEGGHDNIPLWASIMIISCVPMCLSSVYKEKALGDTDIDAVYMNGWIAVFQFMFAWPLLLPAGPANKVKIPNIPSNLWNGIRCLAQVDTVTTGPKKDQDNCTMAPVYVSIYLAFNIAYNILILLILKYGSANILWLAMTVMVPLGNIAFALHFMPKHKPLTWEDIVGLIVIMAGLVIYRFWGTLSKRWRTRGMRKPLTIVTPGGTSKTEAPASPFLTSKSADDSVSTPGRGGVHTVHKRKKQRAERNREYEGAQAHLSSRAKAGYQSMEEGDTY